MSAVAADVCLSRGEAPGRALLPGVPQDSQPVRTMSPDPGYVNFQEAGTKGISEYF